MQNVSYDMNSRQKNIDNFNNKGVSIYYAQAIFQSKIKHRGWGFLEL